MKVRVIFRSEHYKMATPYDRGNLKSAPLSIDRIRQHIITLAQINEKISSLERTMDRKIVTHYLNDRYDTPTAYILDLSRGTQAACGNTDACLMLSDHQRTTITNLHELLDEKQSLCVAMSEDILELYTHEMFDERSIVEAASVRIFDPDVYYRINPTPARVTIDHICHTKHISDTLYPCGTDQRIGYATFRYMRYLPHIREKDKVVQLTSPKWSFPLIYDTVDYKCECCGVQKRMYVRPDHLYTEEDYTTLELTVKLHEETFTYTFDNKH